MEKEEYEILKNKFMTDLHDVDKATDRFNKEDIPDYLKDDADVYIEIAKSKRRYVERNPYPESIKSNLECAKQIVVHDGFKITEFNDEIKDNPEVCILAIEKNPRSVLFNNFSTELKKNRDVVLAAVKVQPDLYRKSSQAKAIRNDIEIISETLKQGTMLEFMPKWVQSNEDLVTLAVCNNPYAMKYASGGIQDNSNIANKILEVMGNDSKLAGSSAIRFLSSRIKDDYEFMERAVKINGSNFEYASDRLRADRNIFTSALINESNNKKYFVEIFEKSDVAFKSDRELIFNLIQIQGSIIEHVSYTLRDDSEIAYHSVKNDCMAFSYVSDRLKSDKDLMLVALTDGITRLRDELKKDSIEWIVHKFPQDIQRTIGGRDPVEVIEKLILEEKLTKDLNTANVFNLPGRAQEPPARRMKI